MSRWWFAQTQGSCRTTCSPTWRSDSRGGPRRLDCPGPCTSLRAQRHRRRVRVRGFISGSGWKEYRDKGTLAGGAMPPGLRDSSRLPSPRFTRRSRRTSARHQHLAGRAPGASRSVTLASWVRLAASLHSPPRCCEAWASIWPYQVSSSVPSTGTYPHRRDLHPDSSRFWEISQAGAEGEPRSHSTSSSSGTTSRPLGWDEDRSGSCASRRGLRGTTQRYIEGRRRILRHRDRRSHRR